MNILVDKGNDKLTTYSSHSDKSAVIKTERISINSTLQKRSNTNPKDSENNHERITNLDNSKPSKTIKHRICSNKHRLMNCETFLSKSLAEKKAFVVNVSTVFCVELTVAVKKIIRYSKMNHGFKLVVTYRKQK